MRKNDANKFKTNTNVLATQIIENGKQLTVIFFSLC